VQVTDAGSQCILSRSTADLDGHVLKKHLSLSLFRSPVKITLLCLLLYAVFATKLGIFDAPQFIWQIVKNIVLANHTTQ
jgi:hypothetical protein